MAPEAINSESLLEDSNLLDEDETGDQTDTMETPSAGSKARGKADEEENYIDLADTLIGIDQAILQSIDKCGMCHLTRLFNCNFCLKTELYVPSD